VPGPHWLLLKGFAFFCFVTILRWSFIRLRIDQFLKISWSGFVPASFLLVLLAVWWVG
jgi:NADH:ubiquinone oxidoreductase subunit H